MCYKNNNRNWIDGFMDLLLPLDPNNIKKDAAFKVRDTNLPNSLFKYFKASDRNIDAIKDNSVWLSCPTNFNDPYDCHFYIDLKNSNKPIFFELSNDELKLTEEELIKKKHNDFVQMYKKTLKVSCLTEIEDSFLMWAHYADSHKGFCIEYSCDGLIKNKYSYNSLLPVKYSTDVVDFTNYCWNINKKNESSSYFWRMAITKPVDFEYEKEWRLITENPDEGSFNQMPPPKAIILGLNIEDSPKEKLISFARNNNFFVDQMQIISNKYKLQRVRVFSPENT